MTRTLLRADIEALLPHAGRACWLDSAQVEDERIVCAARVSADHPLREAGGVPAVHAVEYGAQAAALHRLATAPDGPAAAGRLVQARNLCFEVDWLDVVAQPLQIVAERTEASVDVARYAFRLAAAGSPVASGWLTLMLT